MKIHLRRRTLLAILSVGSLFFFFQNTDTPTITMPAVVVVADQDVEPDSTNWGSGMGTMSAVPADYYVYTGTQALPATSGQISLGRFLGYSNHLPNWNKQHSADMQMTPAPSLAAIASGKSALAADLQNRIIVSKDAANQTQIISANLRASEEQLLNANVAGNPTRMDVQTIGLSAVSLGQASLANSNTKDAAFYSTIAREAASIIVSGIPIIGDAKSLIDAAIGRDVITGREMDMAERVLNVSMAMKSVLTGGLDRPIFAVGKLIASVARRSTGQEFKRAVDWAMGSKQGEPIANRAEAQQLVNEAKVRTDTEAAAKAMVADAQKHGMATDWSAHPPEGVSAGEGLVRHVISDINVSCGQVNCVSSAIAAEQRWQGKLVTSVSDNVSNADGGSQKYINSAVLSDAKIPVYGRIRDTTSTGLDVFLKNMPEGQRVIIIARFPVSRPNSGHATNAIKLENKVIYYDAQSKEVFPNLNHYPADATFEIFLTNSPNKEIYYGKVPDLVAPVPSQPTQPVANNNSSNNNSSNNSSQSYLPITQYDPTMGGLILPNTPAYSPPPSMGIPYTPPSVPSYVSPDARTYMYVNPYEGLANPFSAVNNYSAQSGAAGGSSGGYGSYGGYGGSPTTGTNGVYIGSGGNYDFFAPVLQLPAYVPYTPPNNYQYFSPGGGLNGGAGSPFIIY